MNINRLNVLRFSALVCHVYKKLLDVEGSNLFHLVDLEFGFQIAQQIPQLLLIITDRLIRKLTRFAVKTELYNTIIEMHTKTPLSFDESHWKEG